MWEQTFLDKVREWLAGVAFAIYLRIAGMSKEDFWREQEESAIEHVSAADALQTVYYCKCPSCSATGLLALFLQHR